MQLWLYIFAKSADLTGAERTKAFRVLEKGENWDASFRKLWQDDSKSLTDLASSLEISRATVKREAKRLGLSMERRGKTLHVQPGLTRAQIREEYQLDRPQRLKQWQTELQHWLVAHPGYTRDQIAHEFNMVKFNYLMKYDRCWMESNLPGPDRNTNIQNIRHAMTAKWTAIDTEILQQVELIIADLKISPLLRTRITKSLILKKIGRKELLNYLKPEYLPLTYRLIEPLLESFDQFISSKLIKKWKTKA